MSTVSFYTTTGNLLLEEGAPIPLANYSVNELLKNELAGLAAFNYYAGIEYNRGIYTSGVASDGSLYLDLPTYHINAYGSSSLNGSNVNHYTFLYKTTGATLDVYGQFTYTGLPWVSTPTGGNITKLVNTYWQDSQTAVQDTILGQFGYVGNGVMSGSISSFQEAGYNTSTNKGFAYAFDGSVAASVNYYYPTQTTVGNGLITETTSILLNGSTTTDSFHATGVSWDVNTKIGNLQLNSGADTYTVTGSMGIIIKTGDGSDLVTLESFNNSVDTGYGFDTVYGSSGVDIVQGGFNGDRIYGNGGNDDLRGGNGLDLLDGGLGNDTIRGAKGTDTLTGGEGSDVFIFATDLDGKINIDTITDFVSGTDRIELSAAIFGNVGAVGSNVGLSQYIKYNAVTGVLSYDADGSGAGAAVAFAVLGTDSHPTSVGSDFWIVG